MPSVIPVRQPGVAALTLLNDQWPVCVTAALLEHLGLAIPVYRETKFCDSNELLFLSLLLLSSSSSFIQGDGSNLFNAAS